MKIKTTSWHYKLVLWFNDGKKYNVPTDLCGYMLQTMFASAVLLFILMIAAAFLGMVLAPLVFLANTYLHFLPAAWLGTKAFFFNMTITGTLIWGCATVCGLARWIYVVLVTRSERNRALKYATTMNAPYIERGPGLFATWYKSFKDKTCALLTIDNGSSDNGSENYRD